jgi:hypothetical protein
MNLVASTQLPPLNVLQAWFETKRGIYVRKVSRTSKKLNAEIASLETLHLFTFNSSDYRMKCIVFSGSAVSPMFLWAHINDILKVYWIDSPEHAVLVHRVHDAILNAMHFDDYVDDVEYAYQRMTNFIFAKLGKRPVGDDDIQRYFIGRKWRNTSEAELYIKQIARNETRAGILRRIDLEGAEETISADQPAPP